MIFLKPGPLLKRPGFFRFWIKPGKSSVLSPGKRRGLFRLPVGLGGGRNTGEALWTYLPRPCPRRGGEQGAKAEKDYRTPRNPQPLWQVVWDFLFLDEFHGGIYYLLAPAGWKTRVRVLRKSGAKAVFESSISRPASWGSGTDEDPERNPPR